MLQRRLHTMTVHWLNTEAGWGLFRTTAALAVFLCLLGGLWPAAQTFQQPSPAQTEYDGAIVTSRAVLERLVTEANIPGLSVSVAVKGDIVWSEGFGYADLENRIGVTPLTKFRIGSVSKALTAAAMMTLAETGRLDLDAPIGQYLPQFPDKGHAITARQLAGHLGGIRHYRNNEVINYRPYRDVADALEIFAQDPLLNPPGTKYTYSSFGYNLLSAVIQGASGEEFLSYIERSVFRPLNMRHTVAEQADSLIPFRARFYRRNSDGRLLNARFTDDSYKWASGGFLSTSEDLVRFGSGLLAHRILKRESVLVLFTSQRTTAGESTGYGMGWRPRDDWKKQPVVHHGGSSEGGRAFLLIYPDAGLVIAMLANQTAAPLLEQEAQTLAHFFLEHPKDTLVTPAPVSLQGSYGFSAVVRGDSLTGTVEVAAASRRPGWMQWGNSSAIPFVAVDTLHANEMRIVGVGSQGVLNLWLSFSGDDFKGRWDWLGATVDIYGRRR